MHIHPSIRSVAAQGEENMKRAETIANQFDLMFRSALVKAVGKLEKLPEPRHIISDTHRAQRRPVHQLGQLVGLLKLGGLSHYDARVLVASAVVGAVDAAYADEPLPELSELEPRLIKELAESEAADVRAISTKAPADYMRSLDEGAEAIVMLEIVQRRRAAECAERRFTVSR